MQTVRRKLIKGALAGTVLTAAGCGQGGGGGGGGGGMSGLRSGDPPSTFAVPTPNQAVMSWQACLARSTQEAENTGVPTLSEFDDTYLRRTLPVADGLIPTMGTEAVEGQFFLDASMRWRQIIADGTSSVPTQWTQLTAQPRTVRDLQVLVAIDDQGNIFQTRLEAPESYVSTVSCWSSFTTRIG